MLQYVRYALPTRANNNGGARELSRETVTKVAPFGGYLALGTDRGSLWLLDGVTGSASSGVHMQPHSEAVRDIAWDVTGCYVATCGDDGCVAVAGRRSGGDAARADEWVAVEEQTYSEAMRAVRLDPRYASRQQRVYLAGGVGGALVRHARGWFKTHKDVIVDEGEGPIGALSWGTHWVAWSNAAGVKIMHGDTSSPVNFVPRPEGARGGGAEGCVLFWEDEHALLLGWGEVAMQIHIKVDHATVPAAAGAPLEGVVGAHAEIVRSFKMDCEIRGMCPFDARHLAVLGYPPSDEDEGEDRKHEDAAAVGGERPEFQVVSREDGTIASAEALPVKGYESLEASNYALASIDEFENARRAATWQREDFAVLDPTTFEAVEPSPRMRGEPPRWYVASPRDVVVARIRDVDDAVDLALSKAPGRAKDALVVAAAHAHRLKRHRVQDLVKAHLDALLGAGDAETAASECRRLLGDTETLWEYWVLAFDKQGALAELAPYVPTRRPRLARSVYDMILEKLLATNPAALRDVLKLWGHPEKHGDEPVYSLDGIAVRVDERARRSDSESPGDPAVVEARAELFVLDDQPERALACLLSLDPADLSDPNVVFDLVDRRDLYDAVRDRVSELAALSKDRAARVLARRVDQFPIDAVADQLDGDPELQLWYLRVVFSEIPEVYAAPEHRALHAKHAKLYATVNHYPTAAPDADDYDSELIRFLKWSTFVPLQEALDACARAPPLHNEMVYVLGVMGDARRALSILLDEIGSVRRAVDFVETHAATSKDLWDVLVAHALKNDAFLSGLLDYAEIASRLVAQIPDRVEIPGLKHKLVHIFQDRRFQKVAHQMCARAAKNDCLDLLKQLYAYQNRGIRVDAPLGNAPVQLRPPRDLLTFTAFRPPPVKATASRPDTPPPSSSPS
ncbi:hypothetical protein CTAYLR_006607 [Chrysophaeum taylorii]|uniref:Vps41 beta-propeller domain-containing protein n=1 Tax=Chrysophaeum taylorii TaxID=2483200 RepID=A0AAD7XT64_9STRA|nr:hypothetical protein CTAYLR_006607 [Chrysophaeum taylorii]